MKAVLLLSGGLDSYTAGAVARRDGYELYALTVRYGQVHVTEIASARKVARALGVARHVELDVDLAAFGGSSLVGDGEIPKDRLPPEGGSHKKMGEAGSHEKIGEAGSHEKIGEAGSHEDVPSTYVPARNTIFLSLALGWAEVLGADTIVIGVNALDYSGYPDCRPDYLEAFERLASLATRTGVEGGRFRIMAPLLTLSKAEIIRLGTGLGLDYGLTHSCYAPLPDGRPCGHCDSCLLRAKGFAGAGMTDPVTI